MVRNRILRPLACLVLIVWHMFILSVLRSETAESEEATLFRLGVSAVAFGGLNHNDAAAALKVWSRSIVDEEKLNMRAELSVFSNFANLKKAFYANELEAVTLNVEEIMQLNVWPEEVYVPVMDEGIFTRYVCIVKRSGSIKGPGELLGKNLVSHDSPRMVLARKWVQMLICDALGEEMAPAIRSLGLAKAENPAKAVFQVFFGQADGAVVTERAYTLACELNPQLGNQLKVLAESPFILPQFLFFHPDFREPKRKQLERFIDDMENSVSGRQLLTTFQCAMMERHPVSIVGSTRLFIERYDSHFRHVAREDREL